VLLNARLDHCRFADELERLVGPLAKLGVTVLLSTLPDLTACSPLLPPLCGQVRRRVETVNEVIRDTADRYDMRLQAARLARSSRRPPGHGRLRQAMPNRRRTGPSNGNRSGMTGSEVHAFRALQVPGTSWARCPSETNPGAAEAVHERVT